MTDQTVHRSPQCAVRQRTRWGAVLLGFATFGLLWMVYIPWRRVYVPNDLDIPALADGLLLAPGARWEDWFTNDQVSDDETWPARGVSSYGPVQAVLRAEHRGERQELRSPS